MAGPGGVRHPGPGSGALSGELGEPGHGPQCQSQGQGFHSTPAPSHSPPPSPLPPPPPSQAPVALDSQAELHDADTTPTHPPPPAPPPPHSLAAVALDSQAELERQLVAAALAGLPQLLPVEVVELVAALPRLQDKEARHTSAMEPPPPPPPLLLLQEPPPPPFLLLLLLMLLLWGGGVWGVGGATTTSTPTAAAAGATSPSAATAAAAAAAAAAVRSVQHSTCWSQGGCPASCHTTLAMPSFCAVDLAAIAWALAKWGFQPAAFWLEAFYARLQEVSSQLSCQGMCNVMWAMAILQLQPPSQLLNTLMFEAQVRLPYFTGHGLGTLVWALRTLEAQPPNFWITAMLQVAPGLLAGVSKDARGQPFVNIAWAVSCWQRVIPPSPWMQGFCRVSSAHLPTMSSRSLAVLMLAVADLEHQPPEAWTSLALESFHRQGLDPEQVDTPTLVSFTWVLSRLMTQPRGAPSPSPTTLQLAQQGTTGRPSAAQRLAPFPADQLSPDREAEGQELGGREGPDPGLGGGQGGWEGGEEGEGE
ncbi:hypothetical protein V8C86DRAFT_3138171, partial [Haematococcus lacustris]